MLLTRFTNLISSPVIALLILLFYGGVSNRISKGSYSNTVPPIDSLSGRTIPAGEEKVFNPDIISQFYEKSGDYLSPAWSNLEKITQMISAIYNVTADGLVPGDYHLAEIERLTEKIIQSDQPSFTDIDRFEMLMTDAFSLLSTHLAAGRTNPDTVDPQWKAARRYLRHDWKAFIDSSLNTDDITGALRSVTPQQNDYANLKKALAKYRQIEIRGGWESFSTTLPKLEIGMRHHDVSLLRRRLAVTQGYIVSDPEDEDLFDQTLKDEVIIFQQMNGLDADGVVGKATVEALNVPVRERIETIVANLERWRWISENPGDRYIWVNAADFGLRVMENGKPVFQTRAIVGSPERQTPIFSSVMKYMVLNPVWVVPPVILKGDVIPEARKDTAYFARKNLKIYRLDGSEVNPASIDWENIIPEDWFPYMIRQEPGQTNPLGRIKFMFNNQYDVYIHDTPSRWLFTKNIRTFSSGCIRISNVVEFAGYLLKDDPFWTPDLLREAVDTGLTRTIFLKKPIPVHIVYLTARADDDGTAYFGNDIYSRDRQIITALKQRPLQKTL